jgi:hypothetical protein
VVKAGAFGDSANNLSQRDSSSIEKADSGAARIAGMRETSADLQKQSVDWFHRLQEEELGIRRRHEPGTPAGNR